MDIRIEKTQKAIKNAFLELRSRKNLEKIKQKEENQKTEEENFIKNDDEEIESGSETSEIESEKALK